MSRFADTRAAKEVALGPCECPGAPHAADVAHVRAEFSSADIEAMAATSEDDESSAALSVARYVLGWNLLGPNGEPWPPSGESLQALKPPTLRLIVDAISDSIRESTGVPNLSSAPSVASSPRSASRTQKTTRSPGT